MKLLLVSAAIIFNSKQEILLTKRPEGKPYSGYWEFPGGKIEEGETPEDTIIRELREELEITLKKQDISPFSFASHTYENFHLLMPIFVCSWCGNVHANESQKLQWVSISELSHYKLLPADEPVIHLIKNYKWKNK